LNINPSAFIAVGDSDATEAGNIITSNDPNDQGLATLTLNISNGP